MQSAEVFMRFDAPARRVVVLCERYAKQLQHPKIALEHVALALCTPGVTEHLAGMPLFADVDQALEQQGFARGDAPPSERVPFDRHTRRLLGDAVAIADASGDRHIGPEHLLVALLRTKSGTARALVGIGVDPARSPAAWRATPTA
jgi:ATP-dependent Clp protease ATP-binding subunit ClpA